MRPMPSRYSGFASEKILSETCSQGKENIQVFPRYLNSYPPESSPTHAGNIPDKGVAASANFMDGK